MNIHSRHLGWVRDLEVQEEFETSTLGFLFCVQGIMYRNLNDLLENLNIYFSKDMSLDRNGSKGICHFQGHRKTKSNSVKKANMKWIYPRSSPWIPRVQLEPDFQ